MIRRLIERPIAVTMFVIAIVALGFVSLSRLPISLMPDIDIPQITVQISESGASVREIEQILKPLKNQLTQVSSLQKINSESRSDAGSIYMTFEPGSNIDLIFIEVNEKIDRSMGLNEDSYTERPKVLKASASDIPAFYLNLSLKRTSPLQNDALPSPGVRFTELGTFAREVVAKRVEQLKETAMVDISGILTPELLCIPNYEKLTSMGADIELLEEAIINNNVQLGALTINDGVYRYSIHFDSDITSKEDIEDIYINHNGRLYQFKELCEVIEQPAQRSGLVRSEKENAITMAIIKQNSAKMADLQKNMDALVQILEKEYPDVKFEITRDQTKLLTYSINNLGNNLLFGALLACIIIFIFMKDLRSPVLIIITIPLSLIVTFLVFHMLGITLNIISLSGLVLGVGMMVDNSIIVIDNISQRCQQGLKLDDAIVKAVGEVFTPMLSSVLTTCSVFLPLIFLSGVAGALFYDQAMAVTIALCSSLLVSTLVLPVYYRKLYANIDPNKKKEKKKKKNFFSRINFYAPYEFMVKWVLRHRLITYIVFFATIPATYFVYNEIGKDKLPYISHDDTVMTIDWNSGISVDENDRRIGEVMSIVEDMVENYTSMIGAQQFVLSHTRDITPAESIVYIKSDSDKTIKKIEDIITEYLRAHYPNCVVTFEVSGNIFDMIFADEASPLVAELQKRNGRPLTVEEVELMVDKIASRLPMATITPIVKEKNIIYIADAENMSMYNVTYGQINSKLRNLTSHNDLFSISQGSYTIPVTTADNKMESTDILSSKVRSRDRIDVPLNLLLKETKGEDFKRLHSGNSGAYHPVYIDIDDKDIPYAIETIEEIINEDRAFFVNFSGSYFTGREMVQELMIILMVSIMLLYFILAAQFESIVQPIIILSEIVIDLFWVMLVLLLLGESLNLMSLIGIVVMCGIIINDSILKVDTINRLRGEGYSTIRAIMVGGHSRLKPIIMTSLTTILALVPFLRRVDMGSDLQYPMSVSIIIGMLVGTVVSLIFIPLAYYSIYGKNEKKR